MGGRMPEDTTARGIAATNVITILVVDDNPLDRALFGASLEEEGYVVEMAENGRQALKLLRAQRFDMVLLDLMMQTHH